MSSSAHDPLRYLGDMLAWVHLQAAEGREPLQALFGGDAEAVIAPGDAQALAVSNSALPPVAATPSPASSNSSSSGIGAVATESTESSSGGESSAPITLLAVKDMLSAICDGVARPLAVRIDQVVAAQTSLVIVCRMVDVLAFYGSVLHGLLHAGSGVVAVVDACRAHASKRFELLLSQQAARLREPASPAFPSDLYVSSLVQDTAAQLLELMKVYQEPLAPVLLSADGAASSSRASSEDAVAPASSALSASAVLDAVLNPLVDACRSASEGMKMTAMAVYMLNNLAALQTALAVYPFTSRWVQVCDVVDGKQARKEYLLEWIVSVVA
jgi:conserved oligomeric Golgi complex subunit 6